VPNPSQMREDCVPVVGEATVKNGQFTGGLLRGEIGEDRKITGVLGGQEPRPVLRSPNFSLSPISIGGNQ
jgi:hypothetical protein